jgi:hypothetical protein
MKKRQDATRSGRSRRISPRVEACEPRRLLASFVVTTAADDGNNNDPTPGSLRAAILESNVNGAPTGQTNAITFQINGPSTILPTSELPSILVPTVIDGLTQPNTPVVLDGIDIMDPVPFLAGLQIDASNSTVEGLTIDRFPGPAIYVSSGSNEQILGNEIGTDPTGKSITNGSGQSLGNGNGGIALADSSHDLVQGNVISGNTGSGIALGNLFQLIPSNTDIVGGGSLIPTPGSFDNLIQGNKIGTDASGTKLLGNSVGLVIANLSLGNTIGGTASGSGNIISGNAGDGIADTAISLGAPIPADTAIPPGTVTSANLIAGNTIGSNGSNGIEATGDDTEAGPSVVLKIQGNLIGTDPTGRLAFGNKGNGIEVRSLSGVTIKGNVVSANSGNGIEGDYAYGTQIAGNIIGTGYGGNQSLPNGQDGIDLLESSQEVSITGNQVVDNKGDGIGIHGDGSHSPINSYVADNMIGTIPLPQGGYATGMGNLGHGIAISGAGATEVIGNVIDSNGISGVATYAAQTVYVEYNQIGIDPDGDRGMGNQGDGVQFTYTSGLIQGNGIGSNGTDGIALLNAPFNTIQGNSIGTDAQDHGTVMPNQGNGLSIVSNDGQVSAGEDVTLNKIVENQGNGVEVEGLARGLTLSQNQVGGGLVLSNTLILVAGNAKDGILLDDVSLPTGSTGLAVVLSNDDVASNNGDGLQMIGGGSITSTTDSFLDNLADGVEFDSGAANVSMLDDSVLSNQGDGVRFSQSSNIGLNGVTLDNNGNDGYDITDSTAISFKGGSDTNNNLKDATAKP